jgi:hypothetical protein
MADKLSGTFKWPSVSKASFSASAFPYIRNNGMGMQADIMMVIQQLAL